MKHNVIVVGGGEEPITFSRSFSNYNNAAHFANAIIIGSIPPSPFDEPLSQLIDEAFERMDLELISEKSPFQASLTVEREDGPETLTVYIRPESDYATADIAEIMSRYENAISGNNSIEKIPDPPDSAVCYPEQGLGWRIQDVNYGPDPIYAVVKDPTMPILTPEEAIEAALKVNVPIIPESQLPTTFKNNRVGYIDNEKNRNTILEMTVYTDDDIEFTPHSSQSPELKALDNMWAAFRDVQRTIDLMEDMGMIIQDGDSTDRDKMSLLYGVANNTATSLANMFHINPTSHHFDTLYSILSDYAKEEHYDGYDKMPLQLIEDIYDLKKEIQKGNE